MISSYSIYSRIKTTLFKATTRDATVLCATRNTTIEHGNTPEWDATSEQAVTNKPSGQRMPPTDGRKPSPEELRQPTPFLPSRTTAIKTNRLANAPIRCAPRSYLHSYLTRRPSTPIDTDIECEFTIGNHAGKLKHTKRNSTDPHRVDDDGDWEPLGYPYELRCGVYHQRAMNYAAVSTH